jgi:acetoacetyl-CoA synthetase
VIGDGFSGPALALEQMPGARWYPDARVNYAENVLRHAGDPDRAQAAAILHLEEDGATREISWRTLAGQVASLAAALRRMRVQPGDVVAAVLPNIPEAIIGLLASASIGAVWCICSPDLGVKATLDRLGQLDPVVLIGTAGYRFNGKWFDRGGDLDAVEAGLPTVRHTIIVTAQNPGARTVFGDLEVFAAT